MRAEKNSRTLMQHLARAKFEPVFHEPLMAVRQQTYRIRDFATYYLLNSPSVIPSIRLSIASGAESFGKMRPSLAVLGGRSAWKGETETNRQEFCLTGFLQDHFLWLFQTSEKRY